MVVLVVVAVSGDVEPAVQAIAVVEWEEHLLTWNVQ